MKKVMLMLVVVLMFGLVSADYSLVNVVNFSVPSDVVAGNEFEAGFSFDYLVGGDNEDGSPLIIRLSIESGNVSYPVVKGDFVVSGRVEKSWFFNMLSEVVYFDCSEEYEQTIEHPLDAQDVVAGEGEFYCYNAEGDLDLNEHDEVYLDIVSHYALYPGEYDFSASLFYLSDERAPFVNITNRDVFDLYYRELDSVLVRATIEDVGGVGEKWASVTLGGVDVFAVTYDHLEDEEYYFAQNTPVDITEDDYELFVFAEDESGNRGNDSVVLKIDLSAPEISLVDWVAVAGGMMDIVANVTDEKSGVDVAGSEYRLREMNGSSVCPEGGVGSWDCYDSGWVSLDFEGGDLFGASVNTTELGLNGEYWLEVRALDVLGNEGVLE